MKTKSAWLTIACVAGTLAVSAIPLINGAGGKPSRDDYIKAWGERD